MLSTFFTSAINFLISSSYKGRFRITVPEIDCIPADFWLLPGLIAHSYSFLRHRWLHKTFREWLSELNYVRNSRQIVSIYIWIKLLNHMWHVCSEASLNICQAVLNGSLTLRVFSVTQQFPAWKWFVNSEMKHDRTSTGFPDNHKLSKVCQLHSCRIKAP